jgi:hypothetical protein
MSAAHLNAALVTVGSVGLALGVRFVASPLVPPVRPSHVGATATAAAVAAPAHPDSLVAALIGRDPFRVTRRSAAVSYDPVRPAQPATPQRPTLVLSGIVWDNGYDPTALVEGLPGADGPRPVRQGETIAGLRVKTIKRDRVVIFGLDTTWTLTVREPWR